MFNIKVQEFKIFCYFFHYFILLQTKTILNFFLKEIDLYTNI
jgi:hypothetical protein